MSASLAKVNAVSGVNLGNTFSSFASAPTVSVPSHWWCMRISCVCARGSDSSRRAWLATSSGDVSLPVSAAPASSASGIEPVRKNDRRLATSHDVSGTPRLPALARSPISGRNRNFGDSNTAWTAIASRVL